jgi:glycosyltransferase involved in cell wall biosynthesis
MKISVVISAFNAEKWVGQAIENVLCQTHPNIEIIVVDDGSTDRTAAIAASFSGVKVISQHNQGQSVARNTGLDAATGEWIHFMDVDDLINREYYASMVDAIGDSGERVDMVFGSFVNEAHLDFAIEYKGRMLLTALDDKMSVTNAPQMGFVWRYLIRREFILREGLRFEPERLIEDMPYTLQAVAAARAVTTAPGAMYYYMKRPGSSLNLRERSHMKKLKADYKWARGFRREFMRRHNLLDRVEPYQKIQYKLFGIPVVYRLHFRNGKTKWYFAGVRILQKKPVRP